MGVVFGFKFRTPNDGAKTAPLAEFLGCMEFNDSSAASNATDTVDVEFASIAGVVAYGVIKLVLAGGLGAVTIRKLKQQVSATALVRDLSIIWVTYTSRRYTAFYTGFRCMLQLYMDLSSSRLACRDIQRIQRIQPIQLYSYTRYTAYSTIQPPSGSMDAAWTRHSSQHHGRGLNA